MVEQGRKRRVAALLGTGLAVAAVAGIAIAGSAVARNRQPSHDSAVAGGPDTPSVLPTSSPSANPSAQTSVAATPTQATAPRTPTVAVRPSRRALMIGTPPATADTFAVANNLIPIKDKQYDYFWAAGRLPKGITKITYAFPDDTGTDAVIKGSYWLMQHQNKVPWTEGAVPTTRVKVTLSTAAGPVKSFDLTWGVQTCAQITHGC